jgi:hypothetical protein
MGLSSLIASTVHSPHGLEKIMESMQVDLKAEYRGAAIISGAMMGGLVVYVMLVEFFRRAHSPFEGLNPSALPAQARDVFYGLAFAAFLLARFVRKTILKQAPSEGSDVLVRKLKTATIVTFALADVPAIMGLVLFLLSGLYQEFYALLLFSLLLMGVYFPRIDYWESWVRGAGKPY